MPAVFCWSIQFKRHVAWAGVDVNVEGNAEKETACVVSVKRGGRAAVSEKFCVVVAASATTMLVAILES